MLISAELEQLWAFNLFHDHYLGFPFVSIFSGCEHVNKERREVKNIYFKLEFFGCEIWSSE